MSHLIFTPFANGNNARSQKSAPWANLDQVASEMEALSQAIFGEVDPERSKGVERKTSLKLDVYETKKELIFIASLPGVTPEDILIEATADQLKISGERKPLYANDEAKQILKGNIHEGVGKFEAVYSLPFEINPESVEARFKNGALELHLPKVEAPKPVSVKVNVS